MKKLFTALLVVLTAVCCLPAAAVEKTATYISYSTPVYVTVGGQVTYEAAKVILDVETGAKPVTLGANDKLTYTLLDPSAGVVEFNPSTLVFKGLKTGTATMQISLESETYVAPTVNVEVICEAAQTGTKVTFDVEGGNVVVSTTPAPNPIVATYTLTPGTTTLTLDSGFYICALEGTEITVTDVVNNRPVSVSDLPYWTQGKVAYIYKSQMSNHYKITVKEAFSGIVTFNVTPGSKAELWYYNSNLWSDVKIADLNEGANKIDLNSYIKNAYINEFNIVAPDGYVLESISFDGQTVTSFREFFYGASYTPGSYYQIYKDKLVDSYTITTKEYVAANIVKFKAVGGDAILRTYTAEVESLPEGKTVEVDLSKNETYYIVPGVGSKLESVVGQNGTPLTVYYDDPAFAYNYTFFKGSAAQQSYTITCSEHKYEPNPDDIFTDLTYEFDCTSGETFGASGTFLSLPVGTVIQAPKSAVRMTITGDRVAQFTSKSLKLLGASGTAYPATELLIDFKDAASYFQKIEFTIKGGGEANLDCSAGTMDGNVWLPEVARSNEDKVQSVTFTPSTAAGTSIENIKVTYTGIPTAIETVDAEAADAQPVYYNLQGVRVNNPANGIFVRVCGGKVDKIRL